VRAGLTQAFDGFTNMDSTVFHPNQFQVNEAWIAFRLNDAPIHTRDKGDFNCVVLMDAASCFILTQMFVSIEIGHPSNVEARQLIEAGYAHKQQLPRILFICSDLPADNLALEAQIRDIDILRVPEQQLMVFIADAKEGFTEQFGEWTVRWPSSSKN
jgi:hypothetical protein